jgi:hypothetical protein
MASKGEEEKGVYLRLGSLLLLQWLKISLSGDMRQGPTCVLVTWGFNSANYKHVQENKTTTIHLRSFAEKYLQFIKK